MKLAQRDAAADHAAPADVSPPDASSHDMRPRDALAADTRTDVPRTDTATPDATPVPVALVTGTPLTAPAAIAFASGFIYVTEDGSADDVAKVPAAGGAKTVIATSVGVAPTSIAADPGGSTVVFVVGGNCTGTGTTNGTVWSLGLPGDALTKLAANRLCPVEVATDGANVYWGEFNNTGGATGGVYSLPLSSPLGSPTQLDAAAPTEANIGIAVDSTDVYWADGRTGDVWKVGLSGSGQVTVASGMTAAGVAVDGRDAASPTVYWTDSGSTATNGTVMSKVGGGGVMTRASGQADPGEIVFDGTNLYWVDRNPTNGAVVELPSGGSSPVTLASGEDSPHSITTDASSVYWLTADGILWKLPK